MPYKMRPLLVINGVISPINGLINKAMSLGFFFTPIHGSVGPYFSPVLGAPGRATSLKRCAARGSVHTYPFREESCRFLVGTNLL